MREPALKLHAHTLDDVKKKNTHIHSRSLKFSVTFVILTGVKSAKTNKSIIMYIHICV